MRTALEDNVIRSPRIFNASYGGIKLALTGDFVIPQDAGPLQFLDPGVADRSVFLPVILPQSGQLFYVLNTGTSRTLNVVDSVGIAVGSVLAGTTGVFFSFAGGWVASIPSAGSTPPIVTAMQNWTRQNVVAATGTGVATDSEIYFNRAGVIAFTLPDVELWFTAHPVMGSFILLKDISGNASANNITITAAGTDTIEGVASVPITGDWGGFKLGRIAAGKWGIVG